MSYAKLEFFILLLVGPFVLNAGPLPMRPCFYLLSHFGRDLDRALREGRISEDQWDVIFGTTVSTAQVKQHFDGRKPIIYRPGLVLPADDPFYVNRSHRNWDVEFDLRHRYILDGGPRTPGPIVRAVHKLPLGTIDQSEKALAEHEFIVARRLTLSGTEIYAIDENTGEAGRNPDLRLSIPKLEQSTDAEIKADFAPTSNAKSVYNAIIRSLNRKTNSQMQGQSKFIIIHCEHLMVKEEEAFAIVWRLIGHMVAHRSREYHKRLEKLRIIGSNFDHIFHFHPDL